MKFQIIGKQLREVSHWWFGRASSEKKTLLETEEAAPAFNHLHKNGEMNHMGEYHCDICSDEMRIVSERAGTGEEGPVTRRWQCRGCGAIDETTFRICICGRQTVLEKHAASAREMPVSLNAGGCTECERCVLCNGRLAIGNLKWYYGRWTHFYPVTEVDPKTGQQYTVTRERSKFYGFHCHFSCFDKNPSALDRILEGRTPEWYQQGQAEQTRTETRRLRHEGRCLICKQPLDFWSRVFDRSRHRNCVNYTPPLPSG